MSTDIEPINTGVEVVRLFLDSLDSQPSLDKGTVDCIKALSRSEKLTKTRLLQALENVRVVDQSTPVGSN
jgi:hypothetical protein